MSNPDVRFENHGSVILIRSLTATGKEWLAEHLDAADLQFFGSAIACEPRYVEAISDGMLSDGLEVELCGATSTKRYRYGK